MSRSRSGGKLGSVGIWSAAAVVCVAAGGAVAVRTLEPAAPTGIRLQVNGIGAMTVSRAAHQATMLPDGRVLVTGGCANQGCERILASAEIFDPDSRTFTAVTSMSTPRASHVAVALPDGRVLVAGGWTGRSATASAEVYDPDADRWSAVGDMTAPRASLIATPLPDGRVLVTGGGEGGLGDIASAEVYDPAAATFSPAGTMRASHYLATALSDGRVLLTGGQDADGTIVGSAEIFDPVIAQFRPTGDMTVPRVKHGAALLGDGTVLIVGGSDRRGYRGRFSSTEIYDPATGTFSAGPSMRWGRHKLRDAIVVLRSGGVLVAGGATRLEVLDPATRTFTQVDGTLSGPQMFATATLLTDGDVLLLGGYNDHTRPSDGAWLVGPER